MQDLDNTVERANMQTVTVDKAKLLETLHTNRETHRGFFEKALEGYQKRALDILTNHIKLIKAGKVEKIYVMLPEPSDHTDDYDRAIATLEWTVFDEVELTIKEFDMYVRDNWAWKNEFTTTNSLYTNN